MKKLVVVAMIFLLGTAWWSTIDNFGVKKAEYRQHIAAAEKYEKQQIYYDAVLEYKNALEENPDQGDLWIKIAQDYRNLGSDDEFEEACNQAISLEDDKHEALFMLTDYYLEEGRREDAIALLKRQAEKTKYNGDIKEKLQSLAGEVQTVSADYDEISTECSGYMYVKSGDLYGFLNSSGQEILRPEYQSVGLFGDWGVAPVQKDGESYYIDTNNYKRRQPEEAYQYLGTEKQGIIPAEKDGKWGYLNRQFQPLTEFIYDAATPILDGFGAVKQGESWALIGDDLQMATDFVFSDVLQDEWGFCSRNGVAFVKSGEQYILVDAEGKQLGSEDERDLFPEAIRLISEIKPRAVMLENVRGFLDPIFDEYRESILSQIRELGYRVQIKLLNASDYGVPQLRPRVVIIGIRCDEKKLFHYPIEHPENTKTVGETLVDLMKTNGWKDADAWAASADTIAPTIVGGSKKHGGPDLGPARARKAWAALGVDGIGVANEPPGKDFAGIPKLTPRMIARIQGFPDNWFFADKKTPACRMIGNAFPPPVACAVGNEIRRILE